MKVTFNRYVDVENNMPGYGVMVFHINDLNALSFLVKKDDHDGERLWTRTWEVANQEKDK